MMPGCRERKMDDAIRASLEGLRREFQRVASMYPVLRHEQLLVDPGMRYTAESWWAFAAANASSTEWQLWHGPAAGKDYVWFGRFSGGEAGLTEFKQLVESLYWVIRKIVPYGEEYVHIEQNGDAEEKGGVEEKDEAKQNGGDAEEKNGGEEESDVEEESGDITGSCVCGRLKRAAYFGTK
jgi:hypothetical protein